MGLISSTAAVVVMLVLYYAGAKQQRLHLQALVKSQAALIDAVAQFDEVESQDANPAGAWAATLTQVAAGHAQWHSLDTGVSLLIIGRGNDGLIVHVKDGLLLAPDSPPLSISSLANQPVTPELVGTRSALEYQDADGSSWFEVVEPIPALKMAVLGRLDLDLVSRPLLQALQISALAAIVLIGLGVFLVRNTSAKTVHELQRELSRRRVAEAKLSRHQAALEATVAERTTQLERAHEKLLASARFATLGQVTATVSHELRNPLGTIRTSLHTLRLRVGDSVDGTAKVFDRLERNVMRCDRIIEELLSYTRKRPLTRERIDVTKLLGVLLSDYKPSRPVRVAHDIQADTHIWGDPEDIRRIVVNLLNNAIDATPPNGPEVRISVETSGDKLVIQITDRGSGMTPEVLAKAFEPLFSTKGFGVGLGLPIVKELVERNGGTLELKSDPASGTSAIIRFDAQVAAQVAQ